MLLTALSIIGMLYSSIAMLYTMYINIFRKDIKRQLDKEAKIKYVNNTIKHIEKYVKRALSNPNKRYEIIVENYYGILRSDGRKPVDSKYLTDEDLERIKKIFAGSHVELKYYFSELSKTLIVGVRYPKYTT